jgi:hypothetical protein
MAFERVAAAGLTMGLALVACSSCRRQESGSPQFDVALADDRSPFALEKVTFEDTVTKARLIALAACARSTVGAGGRETPWIRLGNSVQKSWCTGKGARERCVIAEASEDDRDQHAVELSTLHYGDASPYFGIRLGARWVPPSDGWSASFSFSEKGKGIEGEGFAMVFSLYRASRGPFAADHHPVESLGLGRPYEYGVFENVKPPYVAPIAPLRDDLARFVESAESMRDAGLALLEKTRSDTARFLASHAAKVRVDGPYRGGGIPPAFTLRDATPAEEAAELAKANAHFDHGEALLRDHYRDMYAALLEAFPVDRCVK